MYKGNSIVDYLKSIWKDSSKTARRNYAQEHWISGYNFSAQKNIELLNKMRAGEKNTPAPATQKPNTQINNNPPVKNTPPVNTFTPKEEAPKTGFNQDYTKNNRVNEPNKNTPNPVINNWQNQELNKTNSSNKWDFNANKTERFTPVASYQDWINRGKKPTELTDLVTNKYSDVENAEYDPKSNTVVWYNSEGKVTKTWNFDKEGFARIEDHPEAKKAEYFTKFQSMLEQGTDKKSIARHLLSNKYIYKNNKDEILNAYKSFQTQKKINEKVTKFSKYNAKDLYNAVKTWGIKYWEKAWDLLPDNLKAEYEAIKNSSIRVDLSKIWTTNKKIDIIPDVDSDDNFEEVIANEKKYTNSDLYNKVKDFFDNWDYKDTKKRLSDLTLDIKNWYTDIENLRKKLEAKYPTADKSFIDKLVRREKGTMIDNLQYKVNEHQVLDGNLQNLRDELDAEVNALQIDNEYNYRTYQSSLKQYNLNRARKWKLEDEKTTFTRQKEMLKFQTEQNKILRQQQQDFTIEIKNWDKNNKWWVYKADYNGDLLYLKDWKAQKVLTGTWEVVKTKDNKEWSETYSKNEYGWVTVIRTYKDWRKPRITTYDATGNVAWWAPAILNNALDKVEKKRGKYWNKKINEFYCWEWINNYLETLGLPRLMWDKYSQKTDDVNSQTPMVWGVAIWRPNKTGKYSENWHTGIVLQVSKDWKEVLVNDWNFDWDLREKTHWVKRSIIESDNWGYYNPRIIWTQKDTTWAELLKADTTWINTNDNYSKVQQTAMKSIPLDKKLTKEDKATLKSLWLSEKDYYAYHSNKYVKWDDPMFWKVKDLRDNVKWLIDFDKKTWDINNIAWKSQWEFWGWFTTRRQKMLTRLDYIISGDTLQALIDAKQNWATFGALSNQELTMLQNSASKLSAMAQRDENGKLVWFTDEEDLRNELKKFYQRFDKAINKMTGKNLNEVQKNWLQNLINNKDAFTK